MRCEVLRGRTDGAAPPVTNMELFFDLVYVFAVTQLSQLLVVHTTFRGALEGLALFGAVWWAWSYTAWATNWIDPESGPGAVLMIVLMAISLEMSAAIPKAFDGRGIAFAAGYVAIQVVRSAFMVWALHDRDRMRRNCAQLLAWSCVAGAIWIAGAFVDPDLRLVLWLVALAVEIGARIRGLWLPRLGGTAIEDWTPVGTHLARRCQLVLMIALGEAIVRVGLTFSRDVGSPTVDASFVVGFLLCAGLWAPYFLRYAERGAAVTGRALEYAHAIMIAGVIVVAAAIRLTLENPDAGSSAASAVTILAGPALYLLGLVMFRWAVGRASFGAPVLALAGLAILGAVAAFGADRLIVMVCATAVVWAIAAGATRPARESAG